MLWTPAWRDWYDVHKHEHLQYGAPHTNTQTRPHTEQSLDLRGSSASTLSSQSSMWERESKTQKKHKGGEGWGGAVKNVYHG